MKDFIEQQVVGAVRKLLTGRVNEILRDEEFSTPYIEFRQYEGVCSAYADITVSPVITLAGCERTEKERIIRLAAYSLAIAFELPETFEVESHCYAITAAICMALKENLTLDGIVDRAVLTGEKYVSPKKPHCGEGWGVIISLRVTAEEIAYAG